MHAITLNHGQCLGLHVCQECEIASPGLRRRFDLLDRVLVADVKWSSPATDNIRVAVRSCPCDAIHHQHLYLDDEHGP